MPANENKGSGHGKARPRKNGRHERNAGQDRRRRKPRVENTVAIIDRLLLAPVQTTLNGKTAQMTALEAIIYQLLQKQLGGDAQAGRVLLKYEELVTHEDEKRLDLRFIDTDYTRSFAGDPLESSHG